MGKTFSDPEIAKIEPGLGRALARMDALVDWEKHDRSPGGSQRMRVDLGPIAELAQRLGNPQRSFRAVHVAGSKGKGSTANLIAEGLRRAGYRTGLYTSPHIEHLWERIAIDGRSISGAGLGEILGRVLDTRDAAVEADTAGAQATWFDVLTAAAYVHFRDQAVDLAVVECGLGGRLDSTNLVQPLLTVLTAIEREHTAVLGNKIEVIAGEKAGIMAPGIPSIAADASSTSKVGRALRAAADGLGTSLLDVPTARRGRLGERNLALAQAALERLGSGSAALCDSLGQPVGAHLLQPGNLPGLPGRLEKREHCGLPLVLDGAHVPTSLASVLIDLESDPALQGPLQCVFGCGSDKDARGLLKALARRADRTLCTSAGVGPYASPSDLAALGASLEMRVEAIDDAALALNEALKTAKAAGGWVLVTGSLHLVGALRSVLRPTPC